MTSSSNLYRALHVEPVKVSLLEALAPSDIATLTVVWPSLLADCPPKFLDPIRELGPLERQARCARQDGRRVLVFGKDVQSFLTRVLWPKAYWAQTQAHRPLLIALLSFTATPAHTGPYDACQSSSHLALTSQELVANQSRTLEVSSSLSIHVLPNVRLSGHSSMLRTVRAKGLPSEILDLPGQAMGMLDLSGLRPVYAQMQLRVSEQMRIYAPRQTPAIHYCRAVADPFLGSCLVETDNAITLLVPLGYEFAVLKRHRGAISIDECVTPGQKRLEP